MMEIKFSGGLRFGDWHQIQVLRAAERRAALEEARDKFPCKECGGELIVPCHHCDGDGEISCDSCEETGTTLTNDELAAFIKTGEVPNRAGVQP